MHHCFYSICKWRTTNRHCRASFEIMTHIRQMAPLFYIINVSKLRFRVQNETTLISAKNCVDLSSISEVRSCIAGWPRFMAHPIRRNAQKK